MSALSIVSIVLLAIFAILKTRDDTRAQKTITDLENRVAVINGELKKTNEELETLNRGKVEFVSIVSHQLRAPITAIKGYSSMLLEGSYGKLSVKSKKPVEKIRLSSERLVGMVTDFLDLSKIEQGTMSYTFASVDVREILEDLAVEFSATAKKRGLAFDIKFSKKASYIVVADAGKIRQIFSNLIDNALKYTPKGKLVITLEKNVLRGTIFVRFTDTGIGLAQSDVYHIFGKFTRGSEGRKTNTEGSGLGLYVAKKMLEAQRGKIWVDSPGRGKGSTFVVELPIAS